MAVSQNGYRANDRSLVASFTVPGTNVKLALRKGPVATVLLYVLSQFDKRVEDIDNVRGHEDDWGYAERPIRGSETELSNHASGTAADANATRHPLNTTPRSSFTQKQIDEIHKILAEVDHAVRWGGDYEKRADPMHFEVVESLDVLKNVIKKLSLNADGTVRKAPQEEDDLQFSDKIPGTDVSVGTALSRLVNTLPEIHKLRDDLKVLKDAEAAKGAAK